MSTLTWIVVSGVAVSAIALVGSVTLSMSAQRLRRVLLPLVAFATGSFVHIAASDPVPEVRHDHGLRGNALHPAAFATGIVLPYVPRVAMGGSDLRARGWLP